MGGKSSSLSKSPSMPMYKDLHEVKIRYVWTFERKVKEKGDSRVGVSSKIFPERNESYPDKPQFQLRLLNTWEEFYIRPGLKHRIDIHVSLDKVGKWRPSHGSYSSKLTVLDSTGKKMTKNWEGQERREKINDNYEVFKFAMDVKDDDATNARMRTDTMKIDCQVSWFEQLPESNLESDIANLLESGSFSDVKLICSGVSFRCHKVILAARSPFFAMMFQHDMKESNENKVEIEDMEPEVLKEMLQFIYTGNCNVKKMTADLLIAADMYDMKALKTKCEYEFANNLTMDNAMEALAIAKKLDVPYLEDKLQTCFPKAE